MKNLRTLGVLAVLAHAQMYTEEVKGKGTPYEPKIEPKKAPLKSGQKIFTINGREYTARNEENAIKKAKRYENNSRRNN